MSGDRHETDAARESRYCGAKKRQGTGTCTRPAGWGTSHLGAGRCKLHGGSTPSGTKFAARLTAVAIAGELNVDPQDALLTMVRRSAALQAYWQAQVEALQPDDVIVQHYRERAITNGDGDGYIERSSAAELHVAIRAEQQAMEQLVRFSKTALDAGVAERQVRLAEQIGGRLAAAFGVVLDHFGVRDHPDAPEVVRRALAELDAGS